MSKHDRGPADPWNRGQHIHPENSSKGMSRGGRVIGEALRGTRDMHIGGGCQDPRGDRKPPREHGDGHEIGY